jgi:hypothetical protein
VGSGITLEVTAEDKRGVALLWGEERNIIIQANQTTQGNDIALYPANSPVVTAGIEPKTLVFGWKHIRFPGNVDHYQLQVNPDGDSGFNSMEDEGANHIQGTDFTINIPVHFTDWINAVYRVVALDAADNVLATSSEIDLMTTVLSEEVIGYVKASNTGAGDMFGYAVALSADGDTLAVGAPYEASAVMGIGGYGDDDSIYSAGVVYIFRRSGRTWRQQAYVKASNTDVGDIFGSAVAISADGNTLAVGAYHEDSAAGGIGGDENDNSMDNAGAVYVFRRNSGTWRQQAYVKAGNTDADDRFGYAIALSADGNTLTVGAQYEASSARGIGGNENDNSMGGAGAVYVFRRSSGTWQQQAYVKAGNTYAGDWFGYTVALSSDGNTLIVGAPHEASAARGVNGNEEDNSMDDAGAVYVFRCNSGVWRQQAYVKAGNTDAGDWFGYAVALSSDGNTLIVGASGEASAARGIGGDEDGNSMDNAGMVYLY